MTSDLQARTDELNLEAWSLRYTDPDASRLAAEKAMAQSKTLNYEWGKAHACLNLAVGHFYQSWKGNEEQYDDVAIMGVRI